MAFLKDIGNKLVSASQDAIKKTQTISNITSKKLKLSDEQKKIEHSMTKIGYWYYNNYNETPHDETLAEYCKSIQASELLIEKIEQEIVSIQGVCNCEECGAEISDSIDVCPVCGHGHIPAIPQPQTLICTSCIATLKPNAKFCGKCGAKVDV